jgi:predicted Zn-dependent protease
MGVKISQLPQQPHQAPKAPPKKEVSAEPKDQVDIGSGFRWRKLGIGLAFVAAVAGSIPATTFHLHDHVSAPPSQTWITTQNEVELGQMTERAVEAETPLWRNGPAQQRLNGIGKQLTQLSERQDIQYRFKLLDTRMLNAFAVPGGAIYVTRGLMETFKDDQELAFVVGHEMAHIEMRHSMDKFSQVLGRRLATLPIQLGAWNISRAAFQIGDEVIQNRYSHQQELEADRLGQQYITQLGVPASKAVSAMQRLDQARGEQTIPKVINRIFESHPATPQRIEALRQGAQQ